jgi:DNA helicase IV
MSTAGDLEREQAHLDVAYRALAAMRSRTEAAVGIAAADAAAGEVDAHATQAHLQRRLRELEVDVPGLAFGRIVDDGAGAGGTPGDAGHRIGRRHVETPAGDTLVVDWRAPAATPFYRATAVDPQGLRLRRRFATEGARIEALFDEDFTDPDSIEGAHGGVPDPLLAELERARTGEMRDIVATIAAEQDVVIRSPIERCLVVQGGPGTGKTAVGLHRAAFLLYEHRQALTEAGVLVLGPNPTFLRYISAVLPSLGEGSVRQATLAGLVGVGSGAAVDEPERARLLGDARTAALAARALATSLQPPTDDVRIATAWGPVTLAADALAAAQVELLARGVSHDTGRIAMRQRLVRMIRIGVEGRRGEGEGLLGDGTLEADLRQRPELARTVAALWPSISGPALARRLLTNRRALEAAADGVFDAAEQRVVVRKGARKLGDETWTAAEAVLVDECRALVEGVSRTYGHVVVDEAQDLTAMGYRAIGRRCPSGSLTILGDLAQATAPGAQTDWLDVLRHLGDPADADLAELALGYRVPASVLDWANRLLPEAAPGVRPAASVRTGGRAPSVVPVDDVVAGARRAAAAMSFGSVGVVDPTGLVGPIDGVQVVSPFEAKGLEFDGVVVVEPAAIVGLGADRRAGLRLLYIALTRAVQELAVVHREPLPPPLQR